MVLTDLVRPGEKVEIQAADRAILGSAAGKKITYMTKVYDIIDDETLEILMPMEGSKLILLPVDGEYMFCFYTQKGLYQTFVRIADRYKSNSIYILLAKMTTKLEKYQRREYYRYATLLPLKARELMDEEIKLLSEDHFRLQQGLIMKKCTIIDISGGGLKFSAPVQFPVGNQIAIAFELTSNGKEKSYELVGEVLDSQQKDDTKEEYIHRLRFSNILSAERESIIRYIFEEERKKRNRN